MPLGSRWTLVNLTTLAILGCGHGTSSRATTSVETADRGFIVGRILQHGSPVTYFGITLAQNFMAEYHPDPITVKNTDGRFRISTPLGQPIDIIISGPGFARRVLPNTTVHMHVLELGDIEVQDGYLIQGVVKDNVGKPIPGVRVLIRQSSHAAVPTDVNDLRGLSQGNKSTTTDKDGHFMFRGVSLTNSSGVSPTISATIPGSMSSGPHLLPDRDANIDLIVRTTGSVHGSIVSGGDEISDRAVLLLSVEDPNLQLSTMPDGREFVLEDVPRGMYDVLIIGRPSSKQRITVDAGITHVRISDP